MAFKIDPKTKPDPREWSQINYCRDPAHDPPGMIVLPEGPHTHTCPSCGKESTIIIINPTL